MKNIRFPDCFVLRASQFAKKTHSRHCEPAKQSRSKHYILDCFVPRNDGNAFMFNSRQDCFVSRNDGERDRIASPIKLRTPTNDKFIQYVDIQYFWIASFLAMTGDTYCHLRLFDYKSFPFAMTGISVIFGLQILILFLIGFQIQSTVKTKKRNTNS